MKTYLNDTKTAVEIVFNSNGGDKEQTHTIQPGETITFDESEDNGQAIIDECISKGLENASDLQSG